MSKDNPSRPPEKTDQPTPPAPASSSETAEPWQRHETRSRGQLAKDVTSRPPIRREDPAAPGEGTPQASGRGPYTQTPPGGGRQLHEPRSQAQLAKDVTSRPPIRRIEPLVPPASQDNGSIHQADSRGGGAGQDLRLEPAEIPEQPAHSVTAPGRENLPPGDTSSARDGQSGEPAADAGLDKQPDAPRGVTVDDLKAALAEIQTASDAKVNALRTEVDTIRAENRAEIDAIRTQHEEEKGELRQEIRDLRAELKAAKVSHDHSSDGSDQPERSDSTGVIQLGDNGSDADKQADSADITARMGESDREEPEAPERPLFSDETVSAMQTAIGVAGAVGMEPHVVTAAVAMDSARRAFNKLPPDGKQTAINIATDAANLYGTMPPDAATAALVTTIAVPIARHTLRDVVQKIRQKDRDEPELETPRRDRETVPGRAQPRVQAPHQRTARPAEPTDR